MSRDMVTSHVETLIERVTGTEKATPDHDGDYPVRYRDALYYVRVAGNDDRPIVRVFSTVVSDIEPNPDLYEALNDINTRLGFCRCFLVNGQVLIEAEHLGLTIKTQDFFELADNVGSASNQFGPRLAERFGGKLAFDDTRARGTTSRRCRGCTYERGRPGSRAQPSPWRVGSRGGWGVKPVKKLRPPQARTLVNDIWKGEPPIETIDGWLAHGHRLAFYEALDEDGRVERVCLRFTLAHKHSLTWWPTPFPPISR